MQPVKLRDVSITLLSVFGWLFSVVLFSLKLHEYQLLVALFVYIGIILGLAGKDGLFHPVTIFMFCSGFYFFVGPVDIVFFNNYRNLSLEPVLRQLNHALPFAVLLFLFCCFMRYRRLRLPGSEQFVNLLVTNHYSRGLVYFLIVLSFVLSMGYFYYLFSRAGFVIGGGYSRSELYDSRDYIQTIFKLLTPFILILTFWLLTQRSVSRHLISLFFLLCSVMLFVAGELLFRGDRRVSAGLVLALLWIFYGAKNPKFMLIVLSVPAWFFLYLFSAVRSAPFSQWKTILSRKFDGSFDPAQSEFGPFSQVSSDLMAPELYFSEPTFFSSLASAIPTFIYNDKPLSSALWYMKDYYPKGYEAGNTLAFNILVDSALSFGMFGPILLALLYILICFPVYVQRGSKGFGFLYGGLFIYMFSFSARYGFAQIYMSMLYIFAFFALATLIILVYAYGRLLAKRVS